MFLRKAGKVSLFVFVPLAALALTVVMSGGGKPAPTPEDAVQNFAEAAGAGDIQALLHSLAEAPRKQLKEVLEQLQALVKAQKTLTKVLEEKFGSGPNDMPAVEEILKKRLAQYANIAIVSKEEKAADQVGLKVKITRRGPDGKEQTKEEQLTAVKEGKDWKIIPPDVDQLPKLKDILTKLNSSLDRIVQDTKEGKYKDRDAVQRAVRQAQLKAYLGM